VTTATIAILTAGPLLLRRLVVVVACVWPPFGGVIDGAGGASESAAAAGAGRSPPFCRLSSDEAAAVMPRRRRHFLTLPNAPIRAIWAGAQIAAAAAGCQDGKRAPTASRSEQLAEVMSTC
jgi:hypothetical protein